MRLGRSAVALAMVLSMAGVSQAGAQEGGTEHRSCSPVAGLEVCTWVAMEGGAVHELGAWIPMSLIQSVPADAEMVWPPAELGSVDLPEEARKALGLDHLGINWEAHGHPPATFAAPHFDFHFYNLTRDEVGAIDCSDGAKPGTLPTDYVLPDIEIPGMGELVGLCVPHMGMHAMTEAEAEDTDAFEASMILGYYQGKAAFFEPMVAQAALLERKDFALGVPAVGDLPDGVRYPASFRAEYDPAGEGYRLLFTGFGR